MNRSFIAVALVLACLLSSVARAQTPQPADRPGRYLLTRQITVADGTAASYGAIVAQMRDAADHLKADTWWIAAGNVTGDLRRVTNFTFYDSYASFEKDLRAVRDIGVESVRRNAAFADSSGQHVLGSHSSLAALREDLSFNADKVPPSAARYWAITTMYLKAGHMSDFAERTKLEIELLKKAGLDHQFLVYQVLVGVPSTGSVFYVITPIKTLADMDVDDSAKAAAVFTSEVRRRFETLNQQMISGIESDVLMVRPDLSRPPASYVAADPRFWGLEK